MAVFNVEILNDSPALTIEVQDSGAPPVTYAQVKNSLGQYVYLVEAFYLYSTTFSQLIGAVNYNRYDADGNKLITNITTTVDPYQDNNTSIIVDLSQYDTDVVLNGNSSFSATILPNAELKLTMYTKRITSSFGRNLQEFVFGEFISNKPNFFDNYGNLSSIIQLNTYLAYKMNKPSYDGVFGGNLSLGSSEKPKATYVNGNGEEVNIEVQEVNNTEGDIINQDNDKIPVVLLSLAALSFAAFLIKKD